MTVFKPPILSLHPANCWQPWSHCQSRLTGIQRQPNQPAKLAISLDGKWRSFPRVPNLVRYVVTSTYFGRVKVKGKIFRESLETTVFSDAKLRLADYVKKKIKKPVVP